MTNISNDGGIVMDVHTTAQNHVISTYEKFWYSCPTLKSSTISLLKIWKISVDFFMAKVVETLSETP